MRALLDVNLLIALQQPDHVHFERAHQWWMANQSNGWASCPLTQNGFVRIVSQPRYPKPMSTAAAIEHLAEQVAGSDHAFWPDDVSLVDPKCFVGSGVLGPKQLTDIYLLALAVRNSGRLATFDRTIPMSAVCGAEPRHVVVLS